jgi:hypothetical protein
MAYPAERPTRMESIDELRARIPGWGADRNRQDRPAVPKERFDPGASGAHWDLPEQQVERWPRERSIEHESLTPVFGTSSPPKAVSGLMRKYAYRRFSEARAAHWLILLAADRVDELESTLGSFLTLRPDNPITESGVLSEFSHHGITSRRGHHRADVRHQWVDPLLVATPWLAAGALAFTGARFLARRARRT